ncbi:MAG: zf-TFIIB domain-containing protein [Fimbriimonadaceae bacterium]
MQRLWIESRLLALMGACPKNCGVELQIAERSGIVIDFCPRCRGIWLDQGELERFIELAEFGGARPAAPAMPEDLLPSARGGSKLEEPKRYRKDYDDDDDDDDDYPRNRRKRHDYERKKESPLRSIFDLFD